MTTARIVTLGESLGIVRGRGIGSFEQVHAAAVSTGGAEGNVAIGLARSGVSVSWLGRVGDDPLGRRVLRDLRGEGVDVSAIVDATAATGLILRSTPSPGRTTVHYYRSGSAGSLLSPTDLSLLDIPAATLLHLTGITPALSGSAAAAVDEAIDVARSASVPVSFDVNHRARLWGAERAIPALRALVARASLLFAGLDEARLLISDAEATPEQAATALAELGPREVVITLGAGGALAVADGRVVRRGALPIVPIDTVGAGDGFVAAYLAECAAGAALEKRVEQGILAGGMCCLHPGDWEGFPRRSERDDFAGTDPVAR